MIKYTTTEGGIMKPFPPKVKGLAAILSLIRDLEQNRTDCPDGIFGYSTFVKNKSRTYKIHSMFFYRKGKQIAIWDSYFNGFRPKS